MPSVLDFAGMIIRQQAGKQMLERVPEPRSITDAAENTSQYDRVMGTKLALAYAAGLSVAYRARSDDGGTRGVDIACGPGHFTLCLARHLRLQTVVGIDLSAPMVAIARRNAAHQGLEKVAEFRVGDATNLAMIADCSCDLATFTDAAHHLPDLNTVTAVLREMNRITRPEGLVMVMDVVRLRTRALTEHYVNSLGHDYIQRGLPNFFDDFRHSMFAAWTVKELRSAIPRDTARYWCHIVPRGLPTIQIVLGLPAGRKRPYLRRGVPWVKDNDPIPGDMRTDWRMLQATLALASTTIIPPDA